MRGELVESEGRNLEMTIRALAFLPLFFLPRFFFGEVCTIDLVCYVTGTYPISFSPQRTFTVIVGYF